MASPEAAAMLRELQGKNGNGVRSRVVVLASIVIFDFLFISLWETPPFSFKNIIIIIIIIIIRFREDDDDDDEGLVVLSANTVPFVFERFFFRAFFFARVCLRESLVER